MKLKKLGLFSALAVTMLMVGACSSSGGGDKVKEKEKETGKSDIASIQVKSGTYVLPQDSDVEKDEGYLALELTIKNESGKSLEFSSRDIMLYDEEDSKIEPEDPYVEKDVLNIFSYEKISDKKSKTGYIIFPVDKEGKYKLHYEPTIYDSEKEPKPIIIDVNASKYKDNTEDSLKAAEAYVDQVFLAKENLEYDELVGNNLEEVTKAFDEGFTKAVKKQFYYYKVTDEEGMALAKKFREANGEAAEVTYETKSYYPNAAVVTVQLKGLSYKEMRDTLNDIKDENSSRDLHPDKSYEERDTIGDKAAFDKFPEVMKQTKPVDIDSYSDGFDIHMKKVDDKWEIQTKGTGVYYDNLETAFRGEMSY